MSTPQTQTSTRSTRRRFDTTDLALIAAFAALLAVCAIIPGIHVSGSVVPITLQTIGVMLAGTVLGPLRGFLAVLLYLAVGFAGLPIFADQTGGPSTFEKPSIGYLLAFPFAALLAGFLVKYVAARRGTPGALAIFLCAITASILIIHPAGIAGLMWRLPEGADSFESAFDIDKIYWIGDVVKTALVAMVAAEVHRAFPRILGRDRY
ncbi:MAG: bioY [Aeromicrobium sp.]|nr:bioY [Aeromicrobium sp.]